MRLSPPGRPDGASFWSSAAVRRVVRTGYYGAEEAELAGVCACGGLGEHGVLYEVDGGTYFG